MAENVLYYGDNLEILRRYIEDESVVLVYLTKTPPPIRLPRTVEAGISLCIAGTEYRTRFWLKIRRFWLELESKIKL